MHKNSLLFQTANTFYLLFLAILPLILVVKMIFTWHFDFFELAISTGLYCIAYAIHELKESRTNNMVS